MTKLLAVADTASIFAFGGDSSSYVTPSMFEHAHLQVGRINGARYLRASVAAGQQ